MWRHFSTNWRIRTCTSPLNSHDTAKTRRSFTGAFASRLNRSRWCFFLSVCVWYQWPWRITSVSEVEDWQQKRLIFSYFTFLFYYSDQDVFENMDGAKLSLLQELLVRNSLRGTSSCSRGEETDAQGKSSNNECEGTTSPGQISVVVISPPKQR